MIISFFFLYFRHYLVVIAGARTAEDHLEWYGLVESKIRHLISSLEHNPAIKTVHINPATFTCCDPEYAQTPHSSWFLGVEFNKSENINIDLTNDINKFVEVGKLLQINFLHYDLIMITFVLAVLIMFSLLMIINMIMEQVISV